MKVGMTGASRRVLEEKIMEEQWFISELKGGCVWVTQTSSTKV